MNSNLTELVFIVDRSGSMQGMEKDTIGGINSVLAQHRKVEGDANVSIVLFDNETKVLVDRKPLAEVADLTENDYQVRGCTALLDALGGSMHHIEQVQGYMPEDYKAGHVIFVVTTDGYENASRRYTYDEVKRTVERLTEMGWEFLFLGANIDAVGEAAKIGIAADRAATYVSDERGSGVMYDAVAEASCGMRSAPKGSRLGGMWKRAIEKDTRSRR